MLVMWTIYVIFVPECLFEDLLPNLCRIIFLLVLHFSVKTEPARILQNSILAPEMPVIIFLSVCSLFFWLKQYHQGYS